MLAGSQARSFVDCLVACIGPLTPPTDSDEGGIARQNSAATATRWHSTAWHAWCGGDDGGSDNASHSSYMQS